jgi:hypothetical protein
LPKDFGKARGAGAPDVLLGDDVYGRGNIRLALWRPRDGDHLNVAQFLKAKSAKITLSALTEGQ